MGMTQLISEDLKTRTVAETLRMRKGIRHQKMSDSTQGGKEEERGKEGGMVGEGGKERMNLHLY